MIINMNHMSSYGLNETEKWVLDHKIYTERWKTKDNKTNYKGDNDIFGLRENKNIREGRFYRKTAQEIALKVAAKSGRPFSPREMMAIAPSPQVTEDAIQAALWKMCVQYLKKTALHSAALYSYGAKVLVKGPKSDEIAALDAAAKLKATFSGMAQPEPMTTALDALEGQSIAAHLWFNATQDNGVYQTAEKNCPHLLSYMEAHQEALDKSVRWDFREAAAADFLSHPEAFLARRAVVPRAYLTCKKDSAMLRSKARAALTHKGVS
jgi:hypothetical protein